MKTITTSTCTGLPRLDDLPRITTGELAQQLYPGQEYDHALPQEWINKCQARGLDPRGQAVWFYQVGRDAAHHYAWGEPAALTADFLHSYHQEFGVWPIYPTILALWAQQSTAD